MVEASGVRAPAKLAAPGKGKQVKAKREASAKGAAKKKAGKEKRNPAKAPSVSSCPGHQADTQSQLSFRSRQSKQSPSDKCVQKVQGWIDDLEVVQFLLGREERARPQLRTVQPLCA